MSWALPCATEENRIGVPMASAAAAFCASSFAAMWPWSCSMTTKASKPHVKHGVGAERAGDVDALGHRRIDRGLDDLDLLAAEQAAFAGMRIEAADGDLRRGDAHSLAACGGLADDRPTRSRVIAGAPAGRFGARSHAKSACRQSTAS